ncbi:MAG: hypothetical protein VKO65_10005 [Cyanobacteriota bacterium]|nr:hypothetical protein [Cyanobacteriota bacterium]
MAEPGRTQDPFVYTFHNRLRADQIAGFRELQRRFDLAAREFEGYQGQELVCEPCDGGAACVARIRFASLEQGLAWLDSRIRRQLLNEAEAGFGYRYRSEFDRLSFERWLAARVARPAPVWKVNLLVWLALYPLVMGVTALGRSSLGRLPLPLNVLLSTAITVALTGWWLVPWLSLLYRPWLEGRCGVRGQLLGPATILAAQLLALALFSGWLGPR